MSARPTFTLSRLAAMAGGELRGPRGGLRNSEARITGVSIDTRTLRPGDLFVPLAGGSTDGHDFVVEAFRRGAGATLCARDRLEMMIGDEIGPLIVVGDVTAALQRLAHTHRAGWSGRLVGVTGSSGKTTTKDLVAAAFETAMPTLATQGNLNNHWGVPLTLLGLGPDHRAAVVEMGSNHPGEIARLAEIASPNAAVLTNAGTAHLEFFGSVEAIGREKAVLGHAVPAEGTVIAGHDSAALMKGLHGARARIVTFGFGPDAEVRPTSIEDLGPAGVRFEVAGFPRVHLALAGRHQVLNGLAAVAAAQVFGLEPEAVARALAAYRPAKARMEVKRCGGAMLIVDCYNANPDSTRAALETLATWPGARRRIAVLGDMLELGPAAPALHRETGAAVREAELWTVGERAEDYAAGARSQGIETHVFPDRAALRRALEPMLVPDTVVLIKASRGAALEQVLEGLELED